jgi:tetratricopeptide (TPR) repeat protein
VIGISRWPNAPTPQRTDQTRRPNSGRLDEDLDNFRAALDYVLEHRMCVERALQVTGQLWWFWQTRGYGREGPAHLRRLLALESGNVASAERASALNGAAWLAFNEQTRSSLRTAQMLHAQALSIRRGLTGEWRAVIESLGGLARAVRDQGDYARADQLLREALDLAEVHGDTWQVARSLNGLGVLAQKCGNLAEAQHLFERSLEVSREMADDTGVATQLANLASLALAQDDLDRADDLARRALTLRRDRGVRYGRSQALETIAHVATRRGDPMRAARLFGAAESAREATGLQGDLPPTFLRAAQRRAVANTLAQLGPAAFAAHHRRPYSRAFA